MATINPPGFPIERGKIHEFANSLQDDNPMYHDEVAAKAAGLPSVPAPPTYTATSAHFAGGDDGSAIKSLGLDLRFVLHGGQEFEFVRPVFAGDVLTMRTGEVKSFVKEGKRGGQMKIFDMFSEYVDQNGNVVIKVKNTVLQTGGVVKDG